ncbi:hypothetical protein [Paenibacillus harenae]|uniref:Sporulation membrane protein YtrI C-terminal domain-containing protein n=1 Tax=Paenibacillus harenae TaxID=306543 RepID=A0ABT9TUA0_PAEHA|nr:hypothetical protein [Paenibacillus harenae]MDQ0061189.1 hypothetical protein [Paenibacillus harenae]MDQ0110938.1 hypothetical protein [Paenibacillus harenae]
MRLPPFYRFVRGLQLAGVLMLGMLIGAIVYNSIYIAQFERIVSLKSELEVQLEQYEQDIKHLKEFKNQHTVIKGIIPRIETEAGQNSSKPNLDKVAEAELIKRIKEDLTPYIGKSIYEIDSDAQFARILLGRIVYNDVYGKDYAVEVKTMLVADNVLHLWVKVRYSVKSPS